MAEDLGGVWRTVGGRRIFIKDGQDLSSAMKESGKFGSRKRTKEEEEKLQKSIKEITTTQFVDNEDIVDEKTGKKLDVSLNKYMDENGKMTPEREALHQKIINEYFDGKTPVKDGEEKLYYMTGGGAGTGKSTFVKETGKYYGKNFNYENMKDGTSRFKGNMIKLDADDLKIKLGLDKNDPGSAGYLHGESSALVKRITAVAQNNGYNVMLDGTGDGGVKGMLKKIDDAHAKGYKVIANYGTISQEEALVRNWNRYIGGMEKGGNARLVSPDNVVRTHAKVSNVLPQIADKFDDVKLYNNSGEKPVLIARGGNGKTITPVKGKEKAYVDFVNKKDYNYDAYKDYYSGWELKKREVK